MNVVETDTRFEMVVFSFGFKYGVPEDATMVLDVRFLPNPYWEEGMRHLTGCNSEVAAYVLKSESGREYLERLAPMLQFLIKQNRQAGKPGMRVGIGCTGGHHRSVAVVEKLGMLLQDENTDIDLHVFHRDIDKE